MFTMSFKRCGANFGLYFLFKTVFGILKFNQIDYQMCLEIESKAKNFTKCSLEFLRFLGAFGYFLWYFYIDFWWFFKVAQNWLTGLIRSTEFVGLSVGSSAQNAFKMRSFIFFYPFQTPFSSFSKYFSQSSTS